MSNQGIQISALPLTTADLNRLDREAGMAHSRFQAYCDREPEEAINQDIVETLKEDSQDRWEVYLRAIDAVYAVLWADPEW